MRAHASRLIAVVSRHKCLDGCHSIVLARTGCQVRPFDDSRPLCGVRGRMRLTGYRRNIGKLNPVERAGAPVWKLLWPRWSHRNACVSAHERAKGRSLMTRHDFVRQLSMMLRDLPQGTTADFERLQSRVLERLFGGLRLPVRARHRRRRRGVRHGRLRLGRLATGLLKAGWRTRCSAAVRK